jgi:hypothetical protein
VRSIGVSVQLDSTNSVGLWERIYHGEPTSMGAGIHSYEAHATQLGRAITHLSARRAEKSWLSSDTLDIIVQVDDESPLLSERWHATGEMLLEHRVRQLFSGATEVQVLQPEQFEESPAPILSRRRPAEVIGRITPRTPAEAEHEVAADAVAI